MNLELIVDIIHTLAFASLAVAYHKLNRSHNKLIEYVSVVARNPSKARKNPFHSFKTKSEQKKSQRS